VSATGLYLYHDHSMEKMDKNGEWYRHDRNIGNKWDAEWFKGWYLIRNRQAWDLPSGKRLQFAT
jgi:hypothetical protein